MLKHGESRTRLYQAWKAMHHRCLNPNSKAYKNYGGRGIKVTKIWSEYAPFARWAKKNGYRGNLTLDRRNNNKGYSPQNCRWVGWKAQANNRRPRSEW